MRIRTDDEVYRVDAVWLGPPKATMPWRARYVAWGVGLVVFLLVLTVERRMGISLFWSIAWGLVMTIVLTRLICSRISHERPLGSVTTMWVRELTAPREETAGAGGAVSATRVRVRSDRPRPQPRKRRTPHYDVKHGSKQAGKQTSRQTSRQTNRRGPRPRKARKGGRGVRTQKQARA
ncbi:MAG: hypothetical protein GEV28_36765 [Actinophytocola sp.]|uniref:hypothetical protein n=1 Tax=Actinophytocola sp. TaxID=1872138 RepID=UPI001324885A|nr:hypothetical protein [Actinophytocola sp.]MPZ85637.1 hypothetical protein [Actinophytocola sp.]